MTVARLAHAGMREPSTRPPENLLGVRGQPGGEMPGLNPFSPSSPRTECPKASRGL
jgi:hypothetical protein